MKGTGSTAERETHKTYVKLINLTSKLECESWTCGEKNLLDWQILLTELPLFCIGCNLTFLHVFRKIQSMRRSSFLVTRWGLQFKTSLLFLNIHSLFFYIRGYLASPKQSWNKSDKINSSQILWVLIKWGKHLLKSIQVGSPGSLSSTAWGCDSLHSMCLKIAKSSSSVLTHNKVNTHLSWSTNKLLLKL